jgi:membrane protein YqaA with SNARE-associated domain
MNANSRLKEENKARRRAKWGFFIFLILAGIVASVFLGKEIGPFLKGWERYGYLGVFLSALAVNATVILPVPFMSFSFPLAIGLVSQSNLFLVCLTYALGATLGEGIGYILGRGGKIALNNNENTLYHRIEGWLSKHGQWAISILSFQPIFPFDIVGIVAGALKYPFWKFLIFCFLGRIPKYLFLIGAGVELGKFFS